MEKKKKNNKRGRKGKDFTRLNSPDTDICYQKSVCIQIFVKLATMG